MEDAILVTPLPRANAGGWDSLRRSFRGKASLELDQSWLKAREPLFSPGQVRVALAGVSLAVFATLRDRDVFNPVSHFNVPAFPHGDVLEIFIQPQGQAAYYEFHITPDAALLQLRWPEPMRTLPIDWGGAADPLLPFKIARWRIRAQARLVRQGWEVYAEIPLRRIFEASAPWDGARLRASFARYDHTRGRVRPVLSSVAALREPDFHRSREWPMLELRFHRH